MDWIIDDDGIEARETELAEPTGESVENAVRDAVESNWNWYVPGWQYAASIQPAVVAFQFFMMA